MRTFKSGSLQQTPSGWASPASTRAGVVIGVADGGPNLLWVWIRTANVSRTANKRQPRGVMTWRRVLVLVSTVGITPVMLVLTSGCAHATSSSVSQGNDSGRGLQWLWTAATRRNIDHMEPVIGSKGTANLRRLRTDGSSSQVTLQDYTPEGSLYTIQHSIPGDWTAKTVILWGVGLASVGLSLWAITVIARGAKNKADDVSAKATEIANKATEIANKATEVTNKVSEGVTQVTNNLTKITDNVAKITKTSGEVVSASASNLQRTGNMGMRGALGMARPNAAGQAYYTQSRTRQTGPVLGEDDLMDVASHSDAGSVHGSEPVGENQSGRGSSAHVGLQPSDAGLAPYDPVSPVQIQPGSPSGLSSIPENIFNYDDPSEFHGDGC